MTWTLISSVVYIVILLVIQLYLFTIIVNTIFILLYFNSFQNRFCRWQVQYPLGMCLVWIWRALNKYKYKWYFVCRAFMFRTGHVEYILGSSSKIDVETLLTHIPVPILQIGQCKNVHRKYIWHKIWNTASFSRFPSWWNNMQKNRLR